MVTNTLVIRIVEGQLRSAIRSYGYDQKGRRFMQCFHENQQAGNYAFLESRDQCSHGWLGSVASYQPVGESR